MSINHSKALKKNWKDIPPEERSRRMSKLGSSWASKQTKKQIKERIAKMVAAKKQKNENKKTGK